MNIDYSNKKILVIDDFADIRRTIRDMLEDMGAHDIFFAGHAQEAIDICKSTQLDIILSDYNLGDGKDGQQILEELHYRNYINKHMIFIMCTAESSTAMVMGALEYAPDAYLTKPFNKTMLQSRLDKLLIRKLALQKLYQYQIKRNYNKAIEEANRIIEENPRLAMAATVELGEIYEKTHRFKEALELYESVTLSKPLPWALLGSARTSHNLGKLDDAQEKYEHIISQFPMLVPAYDGLAAVLLELNKKHDAIRILKEATTRSPRAIKRHNTLGNIAKEVKDYDAAIDAFKHSIKLSKNSVYKSPHTYYNLVSSVTNKMEDDPETASISMIKDAQTYLKQYHNEYKDSIGDSLACDILQSKLLHSTGREAEAAELTRKTLEAFQEKKPAMFEDSAKDFVGQLIDIGEGEAAESIVQIIIANSGLDDEAVSELAQVAESDSIQQKVKRAQEFNVHGAKLYEKGDVDGAISEFELAVNEVPSQLSSNLNLAQAYLKKAEQSKKIVFAQKAKECLVKVQNIKSDDPKYQRYMSLVKVAQSYV
jgi:CheY-like chemotaxis protein